MATSSEYRALVDQLTANTPTFATSDTTNNYLTQLNNTEAAKPADYQSQYQSTIDGLMDKILNRKSFSYDFNADTLYQTYKDQYTKLGNEAAQNAAANASALTGGYGSSYATTAAAQANQQYLTQLNSIIPDLANAAYTKYQNETEDLYNQFNTVNTAEENAYSKYRDTVSDWQADRDYYANRYDNSYANDQTNYSNDLSKWSTQLSAYQNNMSSAQDQEQFEAEQQAEKEAQQLAYQEWLAEMAYQQSRDAVSDNQWAAEYALSLANANKSSSSSSSGSGSNLWYGQSKLDEGEMQYIYNDILGLDNTKGSDTSRANALTKALDKATAAGNLTYDQADQIADYAAYMFWGI